MTKQERKELMTRLSLAQNRPVNQNRDLLTFTGFMHELEELETHVTYYENN